MNLASELRTAQTLGQKLDDSVVKAVKSRS